jgi:hypothetical protein
VATWGAGGGPIAGTACYRGQRERPAEKSRVGDRELDLQLDPSDARTVKPFEQRELHLPGIKNSPSESSAEIGSDGFAHETASVVCATVRDFANKGTRGDD